MNLLSQLNHEGEFERAWADPSHTRFELPSVDVHRLSRLRRGLDHSASRIAPTSKFGGIKIV